MSVSTTNTMITLWTEAEYATVIAWESTDSITNMMIAIGMILTLVFGGLALAIAIVTARHNSRFDGYLPSLKRMLSGVIRTKHRYVWLLRMRGYPATKSQHSRDYIPKSTRRLRSRRYQLPVILLWALLLWTLRPVLAGMSGSGKGMPAKSQQRPQSQKSPQSPNKKSQKKKILKRSLSRRQVDRVRQTVDSTHAERMAMNKDIRTKRTETQEQRAARLKQDALARGQRRDAESPEQRATRLQQDSAATGEWRDAESPQQRAARLEQVKWATGERRDAESPEQRAARLQQDSAATGQRRDAESPEQRAARLEQVKWATGQRRDAESPEQRAARLQQDSAATGQRRDAESPQQRAARLQQDSAATGQRRDAQTPLERAHRLAQDALRAQALHTERGHDREAEEANRRVSFDTLLFDMPLNPSVQRHFEQNPEDAAMMYHLNSGVLRFQQVETLQKSDEGSEQYNIAYERLCEEIREQNLSDEETDHLIKKFYNSIGRSLDGSSDAKVTACGCCGVRNVERSLELRYVEVMVDTLDMLRLDPDDHKVYMDVREEEPVMLPVDDEGTVKAFLLHDALDIYYRKPKEEKLDSQEHHEESYWLHPDLVHQHVSSTGETNDATFVCHSCHSDLFKKYQVPKYSVKNVHLGSWQRLGLEEPNLMERLVLPKVRHHYCVVKVESNNTVTSGRSDNTHNAIRGHSLLFDHDAPQVMQKELLSIKSLKECIKLHLIGPADKMDVLMRRTLGSSFVKVRPHVIYQWLAALHYFHPAYDDDDKLPSFQELCEQVCGLKEAIVDDAFLTADEDSLRKEKQSGDDVAQVRTTSLNEPEQENFPNSCHDTLLQQTYVSDPMQRDGRAGTFLKSTFKAASELLNVPPPVQNHSQDGTPVVARSSRGSEPWNEFELGDGCLTAAFPTVFFLGTGYGRQRGTLNVNERYHLLLQHTNNAATSPHLLFYLFDQLTRHDNIRTVNAKVKGNKQAFEDYHTLLMSRDFKAKLRKAVSDPKTDEAQSVLRKIMSVMTITGSKSNFFGATASKLSEVKIRNMVRKYGPAAAFVTISPDDINNPTSFRLSVRRMKDSTDPCKYPRETDDNFYSAMKEQSVEVGAGSIPIPFPCNYAARAKATVGNPVAAVLEYKMMISSVLKDLFGAEPNNYGHRKTTNRTTYYRDRARGLFGDILAFYGMTEAQARGSLHYHCLLFGSLSPKLLQGAANMDDLCKVIAESLDKMYSAELPREAHVYNLITTCMRRDRDKQSHLPRRFATLEVPPLSQVQPEVYKHHICANIMSTNMHTHSFTCHKPPTGHEGCRMNYPCDLCQETCRVQLSADSVDANGIPKTLENVEDPPCRATDNGDDPLPLKDKRIIVWELKRRLLQKLPSFDCGDVDKCLYVTALTEALDDYPVPTKVREYLANMEDHKAKQVYQFVSENIESANGSVVAYNPALTACVGSNTAAYVLGNTTQSNGSIYYICPYIAKNKAAADTILTTFEKATNDVIRNPSIAADTGTSLRTVTHLLQRVTNSLSRKMEITDTQAVACLLGMGPELTSEKFVYYGPNEAANYMIAEQMEKDGSDGTDSLDMDPLDMDPLDIDPMDIDPMDMDPLDMDPSVHSNEDASSDSDCDSDNPAINPDMLCSTSINDLDLGKMGTYKIDDDTTNLPVRYNDHYRFRGKALRNLTRVEYSAIVSVKKKVKEQESTARTGSRPGHKSNRRFPLDIGHILHASHDQQLLTKQCVVIFTGREPKVPVKARTKNQKQERDAFARYYLAAFRPESNVYSEQDDANAYMYDWKAFCDYVDYLTTSPLAIDKMRLEQMWQCLDAMKAPISCRLILAKYRGRARKKWTGEERTAAFTSYQLGRDRGGNENDATHLAERGTLGAGANFLTAARFLYESSQQVETLKIIAEGAPGQSEIHGADINHPGTCSSPECPTAGSVKTCFSNIMSFDKQRVDIEATVLAEVDVASNGIGVDQLPSDGKISPEELEIEIQEFVAKHQFSPGQSRIANEVLRYYNELGPWKQNRDLPSKPLCLMALGGPGAGKSTCIKPLVEIARMKQLGHVHKCSYMGIAAGLVGGTTIVKTFKCHSYCTDDKAPNGVKQLNPSQLYELRDKIKFQKLALLVIDECSTMTPTHLHVIDMRLRQLSELPNTPFGGIGVVLTGDFMQTQPVKGASFPDKVMLAVEIARQGEGDDVETTSKTKKARGGKRRRAISSSSNKDSVTQATRQGALRMIQFTAIFMEGNIRAQEDPKHLALIERLHQGGSISARQVMNEFKVLSSEDIKQDERWRFATIIVPTNRERHDINLVQSVAFGTFNNSPVVRWRKRLTDWAEMPEEQTLALLAGDDPYFWHYFIPGANAYCTENLSVELKLANGTPVCLHSLSFDTIEEEHSYMEAVANSHPGDIITLETAPLSVNVVPWPGEGQDDLSLYNNFAISITGDGEPVIPLLRGTASTEDEFCVIHGGDGWLASKARANPSHPYELAFAITAYKAQGRTMPQAIIALEERCGHFNNFGFHEIFVALSRVQRNEDIRLLCRGDSKEFKYDYLELLKPTATVLQFLAGFQATGTWNEQHAWSEKLRLEASAEQARKRDRVSFAFKRRLRPRREIEIEQPRSRTGLLPELGAPAVKESVAIRLQETQMTAQMPVQFDTIGATAGTDPFLQHLSTLPLEPQDFNSLRSNTMILDHPVRAYLAMLALYSDNCSVADPQFWTSLTDGDPVDIAVVLPRDWNTVPILMIPCFSGSRASGHWTALIVDRRTNVHGDFIHFDSNRGSENSDLLNRLVRDTIQRTQLWKQNSRFITAIVPQQSTNDCGPWMCGIMTKYSSSDTMLMLNSYAVTSAHSPQETGRRLRLMIRNTLHAGIHQQNSANFLTLA
jgi:hypothetical protein